MPEAVLVSALPWFFHLIYSMVLAFRSFNPVAASVVGLIDVALAFVILRFGPRLYRRDTRRAALVPILLLALQFVLFGGWSLFGDAPFRALPNVYLIGATLFFASGLLVYGIPVVRSLVRRR